MSWNLLSIDILWTVNEINCETKSSSSRLTVDLGHEAHVVTPFPADQQATDLDVLLL